MKKTDYDPNDDVDVNAEDDLEDTVLEHDVVEEPKTKGP